MRLDEVSVQSRKNPPVLRESFQNYIQGSAGFSVVVTNMQNQVHFAMPKTSKKTTT
jgi:hypothetical protein